MSYVVATEKLTKKYGDRTVVQDLDLRIPEGAVYGFLGPNGSGKSTTMKMLLSLIRPTSGEAQVLGQPMNRNTRLGRPTGAIRLPSPPASTLRHRPWGRSQAVSPQATAMASNSTNWPGTASPATPSIVVVGATPA